MAAGIADPLNREIANPGLIHSLPEVVFIRRLVEGDADLRAALEVDATRDAVPEQHAQHAEDRKNQRKPKEVPLLPKPIDIRCTKQFQTHVLLQLSVVSC